MARICRIALDQIVAGIDRDYDYLIPDSFPSVAPGCRVLVPFSRSNILKKAMVFSVFDESERSDLKEIIRPLDREPLLSKTQLDLAVWMADQYFVTRYQAIRCMIPIGLDYKINELFSLNPDLSEIPERYKPLVSFMRDHNKAIRRSEFPARLKSLCLPAFQENILIEEIRSVRNIGDLKEKQIRSCRSAAEIEEFLTQKDVRNEKQRDFLALFLDQPVYSAKDALYYSGCGPSTVKTLAQKGWIKIFSKSKARTPYQSMPRERNNTPVVLEEDQQKVYQEISKAYDTPSTHLLYGITGSGKTHVYLRLIDDQIKAGRSVLMMVPEIVLTPQMLSKFYSRYGDCVSVLHSGLTVGEKADEWRAIKSGKAKLVVGTRSAVFAPMQQPGLIIMDEEHESSYKSESSPRYHAREIARFLSFQYRVPLILGSATPSLESFFNAEHGRYCLHSLTKRYRNVTLPEVHLIDMRTAELSEEHSVFSQFLADELQNTLNLKEQSILFLNRRGMHSVVYCSACGYVHKCPSCGISLTYHKANGRLMCHYCGYTIPASFKCPNCSGDHLSMLGYGTQFVEDELKKRFPDIRILRMDMDTVDSYLSYGDYLNDFRAGNYDVMLGTQIVAKGLDFPNVTLVGVIQADMSLYNNDFRANERTFNLLTQVCGRSGRSSRPGKAIIQTYCPEHQVISLSQKQDYLQFYNQEIAFRKLANYPPFCDILLVVCEAYSREIALNGIRGIYKTMQEKANGEFCDIPIRLMNPVAPRIRTFQGLFRFQMMIKCRNSTRMRQLIRESMTMNESKNCRITYSLNPIQYQ